MKFRVCLFNVAVLLAAAFASATDTSEIAAVNQRAVNAVLKDLRGQHFNLSGVTSPTYGKVRRAPSAAPQGEPEAVVPPEVLKKVPELIGQLFDHVEKEGKPGTFPAPLLHDLGFPFPDDPKLRISVRGMPVPAGLWECFFMTVNNYKEAFILSTQNQKTGAIIRYRLGRSDVKYRSGHKLIVINGTPTPAPMPNILDEKASAELETLKKAIALWVFRNLKPTIGAN